MMLSRRSGRMALLILFVTALHLWLAGEVLPARLGEGDRERMPKRMEVTFVRELAPTAPPTAPPVPTASTRPRPARAPNAVSIASPAATAAAASAADTAELAVFDQAKAAALVASSAQAEARRAEDAAAVTQAASAAAAAAQAASDAAAAQAEQAAVSALAAASSAASAASAPAAAAFEWPPSTRLTYNLTGYYLGPVQGQALVEWVRLGSRYQVRMDVSVGPLLSRKVVSTGEVTDNGLRPLRYDEETRVAFRQPRHVAILFDDDSIHLPTGEDLPRQRGVQDSASQFVQLTWLFTTQPALLRQGNAVQFPLALPRRVEPWIYDVVGEETLSTPAGPLDTFHVKPRREGKTGELTPEFWVAPTLQYLPVRIVIRQDAQTFIDLLIDRLPAQAERGR